MKTPADLALLFPRAAQADLAGLAAAMPALAGAPARSPACARLRATYFLAQIGHESRGLTLREEALDYTAQRLTEVWPARFSTLQAAKPFAHAPQALADKVYDGRMGNDQPGDGWRFRGRGYIQITGRGAYAAVGVLAALPLEAQPDLAADPVHAGACAVAFWTWRRLNRFADTADFVGCTRALNGGLNGLADRQAWLARAEVFWRTADSDSVSP